MAGSKGAERLPLVAGDYAERLQWQGAERLPLLPLRPLIYALWQ